MTCARGVHLGGLLLALAMGRPLGAQARSTLELGASYVRFPQDSTSVAGPSASWLSRRTRGAFASTVSLSGVAGRAGMTGYGELGGRWLTALGAGWRGELGGDAGALVATQTGSASPVSTSTVASARVLHAVGAGGVWLGGSGNAATREAGLLWGRAVDAGAWWRRAGLELVAALTHEWTVAQLFTGPGRERLVGVEPVHYVEGSAGVLVQSEQSSVALSAQLRRDPGADQRYEPGVTGTVTVWRTSTQAFFASFAKQLPDFVHGADATQSVTIGIRLNEPSPAVARVRAIRPIVQVGDASAAADSIGASQRRTLRVRAAGASQVEVMGDFTEWEPAPLALTGDVFSASFELTPGTHRVVVRIDNGPWMPAANTPAVDDDFGGKVGLLLVP
ncbi:MAG: hypothetical protein HOQ15_04985 [Gemmatimonadaceae bacterium]|nr:hypothetical protein [Gemmatimonadaceae bacterium]